MPSGLKSDVSESLQYGRIAGFIVVSGGPKIARPDWRFTSPRYDPMPDTSRG
jgi:hypothetical protein